MKENRNEIEITATAEQVWQVLADLERYAEWNPLLYRGSGKVAVGEKVTVSARTATMDMDFLCTVVQAEPFRQIAWTFHVMHPILFRGLHSFTLEPASENRVKFIDREQFKGMLLPMKAKDLTTNGLAAMIEMGMALKKRVEGAAEA